MADFDLNKISMVGSENAGAQATVADQRVLHFEEWAGQVFANYTRKTPALNHHMNKTAPSGKRHTFSEIGDLVATGHTMGTQLAGQAVKHGARYIDIEDKQIIADAFSANADQLLAVYDDRSHLAKKAAEALANRSERDVFRNLILAGGESVYTPPTGGAIARPTNALNEAALKIGSAVDIYDVAATPFGVDELIAAASQIAQLMDEKDVPDEDDRVLWVRPAEWYLFTSVGNDLINTDFNPGSKSNIQRAVVDRVSNLKIVKSNNWKAVAGVQTQSTVDADLQSGYEVDAREIIALVSRPDAVGTVHLRGITPERAYDARAQGDLILAKMFKGTGVLRPEAAGFIYDSNIVP